jgi:ABC-type multidrug transport system permease subunit
MTARGPRDASARSILAGFTSQMRLSGLSPLSIISSALTPLTYGVAIISGFGEPSGALLLGCAGAAIWGSLQVQGTLVIIQERAWGTLQMLTISPTPIWAPLIGRLTAVTCQAMAAIPGVLLAIMILFGGVRDIRPGPWIAALMILTVGLAGMSLVLMGALARYRYAAGMVNGLFGTVLLIGGFFVPLSGLPTPIQQVGYLLPSSWALAAVRENTTDPSLELLTAVLVTAAWVTAGAAYLSSAQRRLRNTGAYHY